jgi:hypothetical protein
MINIRKYIVPHMYIIIRYFKSLLKKPFEKNALAKSAEQMKKWNNIHGVTDTKRKYIEGTSKIQLKYIKIKLPEVKYT